MRPTEYDIKNEHAMDAVCNAIKHNSASIYDFHYDDVNIAALEDIYYRHIDATIIANARNVTSEQSIDHIDNLTEIFGYHGALKIGRTISDTLEAERGMII